MSTDASASAFYSSIITQYVKSTENTTALLGIAAMLIIIFIISPLSAYFLPAFIGKICVLLLLGYIIHNNITQTNKLTTDFKINMIEGEWNTVKTNVVFNYVFSGFLLILMFTIINKFFPSNVMPIVK